MSLTKEILRITARHHPIGYSQLFEHIYKETVYGKKLNKRTVHSIINRLEKGNLITTKGNAWHQTKAGKTYLEKEVISIRKFANRGKVRSGQERPKRLIAIFDIPEKRKRWREWLRGELIGFGFTMIQKSVWLGPALPKDFLEYLNEIGLIKHIRFFAVSEKDLI